jgi:hypothetical protein
MRIDMGTKATRMAKAGTIDTLLSIGQPPGFHETKGSAFIPSD